MRLILLILGIPAIVLLFLPYSSNTSPWDTIVNSPSQGFAWLGAPFFLAIVIFVAQARMFLTRHLSRTERRIGRILAFAALASGVVLMILMFRNEGFTDDSVHLCLAFGIPFLVAVFLIIAALRIDPGPATVVVLKAAWLPNAIMCGIAFWPGGLFSGWQIGAYFAAFTIVVYSAEIALSLATTAALPKRSASSSQA